MSTFRFVDLIHKKREGGVLSSEEINKMITSYVKGDIPDYQMSAMMMAVFFRGLNDRELTDLTLAMRDSGDIIDLSRIEGIKVDKHSTGGVGDKTTLIIGPIVAACGIPVAKMSGRGLGFTGGTYDKLESIPGYRVNLDEEEFFAAIKKNNISLIGPSGDLAPADKFLYALRDVTATVESIPLIASSIMSKKLAAGSDKILLDVTTGNGAFIKDIEKSRELAKRMVAIGNGAGKETVAILTSMDEPLGFAIGNNLEVKEAIAFLREYADGDRVHGDTENSSSGTDGSGARENTDFSISESDADKIPGYTKNVPGDLAEVCFALAGMMISMGTPDNKIDFDEGVKMAKDAVSDGRAWKKLLELVETQGGDTEYLLHPEKFPVAPFSETLCASADGYIDQIDTEGFGIGAGILGAGREKKEDSVDPTAGIVLLKKYGDHVNSGEPVAKLYSSDETKLKNALTHLSKCYGVSEDEPAPLQLIRGIVK